MAGVLHQPIGAHWGLLCASCSREKPEVICSRCNIGVVSRVCRCMNEVYLQEAFAACNSVVVSPQMDLILESVLKMELHDVFEAVRYVLLYCSVTVILAFEAVVFRGAFGNTWFTLHAVDLLYHLQYPASDG